MGKSNKIQVTAKIVLLGAMGVGKTSLVEKFIYDVFQNPPNTIGAAYAEKKVEVNDKLVKLQVWDTGGQERYRAMAALYFRDAKVAIVCYSVAQRKTLEAVRYWAEQLQVHEPDCKILLCGTKRDLLDKNTNANNHGDNFLEELRKVEPVQRSDLRGVLNEFGIGDEDCYQTSSKTGDGVSVLFTEVADHISKLPTPTEIGGNAGISELRVESEAGATKKKCKCG